MAANDRESTFTIKAADLSTQQINQVIATVERLVGVMEKANKATQDGTIKTTDFNKAQKDLGTGADAVARQITTLQRYAAVREEVAQREQKLADMRARADELAARSDLNRGEKAELNRLTKDKGQIEQAQKSLDRQNEAFAKSEQAMAAMGSSSATLGADLDRLRGFAQQVQAAVDAAAAAQLHLTENQMKAAEAAKAETAAQQALARALQEIENVNKAAVKDAEQAAKAAGNTIKEVNQAEVVALGEVGKAIKDAENAQKARTKQREADMQAQLDQYNFEQRVNKLALADADARLLKEKQLAEARERIAAQRDLTAQALNRAPPVTPLGQPAEPVQDYSKVSRGLSELIDPAAAARQTIDGLTGAIDKLLNTVESGTRKPKDLENDLRKLGNAAQDLKRMGGLIDTFQAQEAAVNKAQAAVKEIEVEMDRLAVKGRTLTGVDKAYQNEVKQTEAELNRLRQALEQENREYTRQAEILQRAGINYRNLDEDVSRLRATASGMGKTFTEVAEKAEGKKGTLFLGLRPYELQNLSYQINDIFTQLGSGTPIMQVFAQQGGQVFQLFQMQLLDVLKSLRAIPFAIPGIVAGVAALTVGFLAFARAMEEMAAQRTIMAQLAMDVDGAAHSAPGLMEAARAAERLGAGFEEAAKGGALLARSGFSRAQIQPMLELAAKFSVNTGKTFADSLKLLSDGFTGGYEAARKLAGEYGLLTDAQDKRIHDLVNENKLEEAHAELLTLVTARINEGYTKGLSPFSKAVLDLKNNWHDLLGEIGKWDIWTELVNRLTTTAREVKGIIDAIKWLDEQATRPRFGQRGRDAADVTDKTPSAGATPEQLKAQIKALEQRLELQEKMGAAPVPLEPTTPKTPGYGGEGFTAARDQVADMVGLNREALKKLQESEGVWIEAQKRWQNAHENFPESHATGPMQLQPATFDALKKQYPDLITGDINDLKSNLIAGAIELRKQIEAAGGNFRKGVEGYHMGGVDVRPDAAAVKQGDQVAAGFVGPAIQPNNPAATRAAIAALKVQLAEVEKAGPAAAAAVEGVGTATNSVAIVTRNWAEQQDRATRAQEANVALNFEQRQKRLAEAIKESDEAVVKSAADFAKLPENAGRLPDPAEIKRVQAERVANITRQYAEKEFAVQNGLATELEALREAEGNKDKTNLDQRLTAFNTYWNARERKVKEAQRLAADQGQADQPGAMEEVAGLRAQSEARLRLETANAIVDKALENQKNAFDAIERNRAAGVIKGAESVKQLADAYVKFPAAVREAVEKATKALEGVADSPAVQSARQRYANLLAVKPQDARKAVDQTISVNQEDLRNQTGIRDDKLAVVESTLKRGGESLATALPRAVAIVTETRAAIAKTVDDAQKELQALSAAPGLTDERQRAKIERIIEEGKRALAKNGEDLEAIITAGLADADEKLKRDLDAYNKERNRILKDGAEGIIGTAEMMARLRAVTEKYGPTIKSDADAIKRNVGTALAVPDLRPGFRSSVEARGAAADDAKASLRTNETDDVQKGISSNLKQLSDYRSLIADTEREQKALMKIGGTDVDKMEAARSAAYRLAQTEGAKVLKNLEDQIAALERLGGHASEIAKLKAAMAEFKAETQYASEFQKQLIQGFEQSFVSRGTQAFDAIAKSIGTAIVTGGKFKDVLRDTGNAFANMTAGILEDIAKIIIKYELLKLAEDLLGTPKGALSGGGGGGGSSTGGILQGLLKVAGIAASAFAGGAGAVSDAGEFVSAGGGAATAADADALGAFGNDAAGAGMTSEEYAQSLVDNGASQSSVNAFSGHKFFHEGGMVGWAGGMSRPVDLSVFHEAQRMHSGGLVGLAHDEVPAILQKNEEVLAKNDPRNRLNAAPASASGGGPTGIRNVLAVGDREIAAAMNGSHGERVILNVLQRNAPTVKKYVG